jgi:phage virion morphogenesis protein
MPIEIKISSKDFGIRRRLGGMDRRLHNLKPALQTIGEIGLTSIQRNFEEEGRPRKWKPLRPATIRQREREGKWPGQILIRRGVGGGLLGSIYYQAGRSRLVFTAKKIYAAIHHFGGEAGRGRKVTIPARPFMMLQTEDRKEIRETLMDFVKG